MTTTETERPLERRRFLQLAIAVEGGMIVAAFVLSWLLETPLVPYLAFAWDAIAWGIGAALLMTVVFWITYRKPIGSVRRIQAFLDEGLGPALAACKTHELLLVALLAGVGEELLFRGILQPWLEGWEKLSYITALFASNVVFGLCHAITATYALIAFLVGCGLGLLLDAPERRNLIAPILAHGLYDFAAFVIVAKHWRDQHTVSATPVETSSEPK